MVKQVPCVGDKVFSIGFGGLLSPNFLDHPFVHEGNVRKVAFFGERAFIVHSNANVQSGSSGGALVNQHNELVGIIAQNAKIDDKRNGSRFIERLSFAISVDSM